MKKLLALFLAVLMLLSLAACNGDSNQEPKDTSGVNNPADPTDAPADPETNLPSYSFSKFGNGKITIVGAEFAQDDYGDDFLRVYYDYTNTAAIGCTPYYTMEFDKVMQDGEEIDEFSVYEDDECAIPEDLMSECSLLPGRTARCTVLFECSPDAGVVDIGCYLMIGSWMYNEADLEWFEFQIDPDNMMGAPEPMEYEAITNPTYTANMPTSGIFDCAVPFEIALNGYELTTYDELPALRVCMTYTNTADDAWPPSVVLPINAYQDGIGLALAGTWYLDDVNEADEAFEENVEPGQTVACNAIFLLRNSNPVEVVVEEDEDYPQVGMVCDVRSGR